MQSIDFLSLLGFFNGYRNLNAIKDINIARAKLMLCRLFPVNDSYAHPLFREKLKHSYETGRGSLSF